MAAEIIAGGTAGYWTTRNSSVQSRDTQARDRKEKKEAGQRRGESRAFSFSLPSTLHRDER